MVIMLTGRDDTKNRLPDQTLIALAINQHIPMSKDDRTGIALASSHAVTLGSTLKVGYQLFADEMPTKLSVFLIEAEDYFEFANKCSPSVALAIDEVVRRITVRSLAGGNWTHCQGEQDFA